ncbi:hypothetical protein LQG66_20575 [Bradyrhizobium ontarionense]|uniref:Lipoprotein n=1 Tax=Bradyrhizobium ontarionense TaxID=2898149 RepID=A0ABY3R4P5_9BRAD|nr:hypothetical protein [Bradyrhizobium sp. A19]UFZ01717.1 hypothetical protein LQG66_20575 [Bradyrhizobium sp. A19]
MGIKAALPAVVMAAMVFLGGCAASPEGLNSRDDADSRTFSENYEEIFRRLSETGKRCYPPGQDVVNPTHGQIESEGELHRDRGFAEFRLVAGSYGIRMNYFVAARIEKSGSGSRVTIKVSNPMGAGPLSSRIYRWAGGDSSC